MTITERKLIQSADVNTPFRVLLVTEKSDSLVLRKPCRDVDIVNDSLNIKWLIARMKATMKAESGVGIAAPQIGLSRNVFLFVRVDKPDMPVEVAINPKIIEVPVKTVCFERDGCLSIPDVSGNSIRYPWVKVEYYNENDEKITEKLTGYSRNDNFVAVIFQHEFDHLQGILFTDKLCEMND
ncbi:MAG: peptide deformylase [Bacteroidales bacterium]|nr:peptide deformylase [Bacteroidales bacterium]